MGRRKVLLIVIQSEYTSAVDHSKINEVYSCIGLTLD